jgi:hypothetical protein
MNKKIQLQYIRYDSFKEGHLVQFDFLKSKASGRSAVYGVEGRLTYQYDDQYRSNRWFICQNEKEGSICADRFGYKCSWVLGKDATFKQFGIENFRILRGNVKMSAYIVRKIRDER